MRSAKAKSGSAPLVVGALIVVLGLVAGAFLLLSDEGSGPASGGGVAVPQSGAPEPPAMVLPEVTGTGRGPERLVAQPPAPSAGVRVEATDPEAPTGRIEGVCLDSQGRVIEGVEVRLGRGSPIANMTPSSLNGYLEPRATSDDAGRFALEDVPVGKNYVLVGEHPDYAPATARGVVVRADETLAGQRLVLVSGATVGGLVATLARTPLSGARVELYDTLADARLPVEERRPRRLVLTDGSGRFELRNIAMPSFKLRVQVDGYETQTHTVNTALSGGPEDMDVEFLLGDGRSLPGRVVDDLGAPVAGARVVANAIKREFAGDATVLSDAGGYFLLDGLGVEQIYQVRCTAHGFSDQTLPSVTSQDSELLFELRRRLQLEGVVRDDAGDPVSEFSLVLMRGFPNRESVLTGDLRPFRAADGRFVFDDLEPGTWAFQARAPGFAPTTSEAVELSRDEDPPEIEITMETGGTLRGVVRRADGSPVEGALVRLNEDGFIDSPLNGLFSDPSSKVDKPLKRRTNAKGRFVLPHVPPGIYQVAVSHHQTAPFARNGVEVFADDVQENPELVLELPAPGSIEGRAFDENRRMVPHSRVQLASSNGFVESVTTDDTGYFRFDNLAGGQYSLTLYPQAKDGETANPFLSLALAQKSLKQLRLLDGQAMTGVELYTN
jgi:hypothetical protein